MTCYIPDPIQILERQQAYAMDRVRVVDGVDMYPCDQCGNMTPLDELEAMDPLGLSAICLECYEANK